MGCIFMLPSRHVAPSNVVYTHGAAESHRDRKILQITYPIALEYVRTVIPHFDNWLLLLSFKIPDIVRKN